MIPGIGEERARVFKGKGIETVGDFVEATSDKDKISELADDIGISDKVLGNWRKKAKALLGK